MKLAVVAPSFASVRHCRTRYNLTLAHLYEDERYKAHWIKRATSENNYVILDNGAAEGVAFSPKSLYELAIEAQVHEVVAPDYLANGAKTRQSTQFFLDMYYASLFPKKVMGVVQGDSMLDWIASFEYMMKDPRIGVLGLPKIMDRIAPLYSRAGMIWYLRERLAEARFKYKKEIHLLGMSNWVGECAILARDPDLKWIRGMDTTYPILAAEHFVRISNIWEKRIEWGPHTHTLPRRDEMGPIESYDGVAAHNVDVMVSWLQGEDETE